MYYIKLLLDLNTETFFFPQTYSIQIIYIYIYLFVFIYNDFVFRICRHFIKTGSNTSASHEQLLRTQNLHTKGNEKAKIEKAN